MYDEYLDRVIKEAVVKYETPHVAPNINSIYNMMALIEVLANANPEFKKDLKEFVSKILEENS